MRSVIFSAAAVLGLAAFGLTVHDANAQSFKPPKQDCHQAPDIQSSSVDQDQSCNTVFSDRGLLDASVGELIQSMVRRANLPNGPFRRIDLDPDIVPNNLDYLTLIVSTNSSPGVEIGFGDGSEGSIEDQIGFDPGVTIRARYTLDGNTITITDITDEFTPNSNQILNGCFDGVMLIKNGGKNQTVTVIADVDMWYDDGNGMPCGLVFTADHTINTLILLYLVGPSGFTNRIDIGDACGALNVTPGNQENNVSYITGAYPSSGDGSPPATNLTGCFGEASYCDFSEKAGLPNACFPADQPFVGAPNAQTSVATGPPIVPPGLLVASQAIETLVGIELEEGDDQTSTVGGGESTGSLVPCCSFPSF